MQIQCKYVMTCKCNANMWWPANTMQICDGLQIQCKYVMACKYNANTMQIRCGVNVFILDSRRVLAPAPKVLGSDIKTSNPDLHMALGRAYRWGPSRSRPLVRLHRPLPYHTRCVIDWPAAAGMVLCRPDHGTYGRNSVSTYECQWWKRLNESFFVKCCPFWTKHFIITTISYSIMFMNVYEVLSHNYYINIIYKWWSYRLQAVPGNGACFRYSSEGRCC